jgi:hypothetical protein
MKPKRVAVYARVSTDAQTTDNQLREIRTVAKRAGWQIVHEFVDRGVSGAKGRDHRLAFDRMTTAQSSTGGILRHSPYTGNGSGISSAVVRMWDSASARSLLAVAESIR